jgi:hypothetical protein
MIDDREKAIPETGIDWDLAVGRPRYDASDAARLGDAVGFLREGIDRMAGGRAAETRNWLLRFDRSKRRIMGLGCVGWADRSVETRERWMKTAGWGRQILASG